MSEDVNKKVGAPTKYKKEYNEQTFKICLLGATDSDLAGFFNVSESTINKWKLDYPEFSESIRRGKEEADANVANRLYKRALGYSHAEEKIFNDQGSILRADTVKHYPPDTTAAIFWLKNRQPKKWRDSKLIQGDEENPIAIKQITGMEIL